MDARSEKNLVGVHPRLVNVIRRASEKAAFIVVEGVRTDERQQDLYAQGRTKPGVIVTQVDGVKKKSNHQRKADGYGHAVDVYPDTNKNGKVDSNEVNFSRKDQGPVATAIMEAAKELCVKIEWGGNWKFIDLPHFELKL